MTDEIDLDGRYLCYYCEEVVQYDKAIEEWVHVVNGELWCNTIATPSNMRLTEMYEHRAINHGVEQQPLIRYTFGEKIINHLENILLGRK